ncbi:uncharacterized protein LOC127265841 [Andrographis paniculata]|uniref:uncharacterized protein LOC127265841 n=1 Tax=Andrographis paniculata TaxID=175694 RepID=UPI0021E98A7D|nr:uncharacterized protein LOC127265841 [Andrographis paniculata]
MAKNRNKKKKNGSADMAVDVTTDDPCARDEPHAMDTSETVDFGVPSGGSLRKTKKGRPMKRSKNTRKMKAIAKAVSLSEKSEVKLSKSESKAFRTKTAKNLYD